MREGAGSRIAGVRQRSSCDGCVRVGFLCVVKGKRCAYRLAAAAAAAAAADAAAAAAAAAAGADDTRGIERKKVAAQRIQTRQTEQRALTCSSSSSRLPAAAAAAAAGAPRAPRRDDIRAHVIATYGARTPRQFREPIRPRDSRCSRKFP